MAAAQAAQKAPETKYRPAPAKGSTQKEQKKPLLNRPAGIAVCILLLCLALVIGNGRALQKATPKSFLRQGSVASLIDERISSAKNAESVSKQADLEVTLYEAVDSATDRLKKAKTAREVSLADQALMSAVGEMAGAAMDCFGTNSHLTSAMDTFNDAGNMLRFEAQEYNQKAQKAENLYENLPLRMLFGRPDVYEGI